MKLTNDFGIKALFGTIILCFAAPALCYLAISGNSQALTTLGTLATAVVAFYFGARSQTKQEK